MTEPYNSPIKEVAWQSWLQCRRWRHGENDLDPIHVKTARTNFERWYGREYE